MNVHNKVNSTLQFIDKCLQGNITRKSQSMTQHKYLTKMANAIIDENTGKELSYRKWCKIPNIRKYGNNPLPTNSAD